MSFLRELEESLWKFENFIAPAEHAFIQSPQNTHLPISIESGEHETASAGQASRHLPQFEHKDESSMGNPRNF